MKDERNEFRFGLQKLVNYTTGKINISMTLQGEEEYILSIQTPCEDVNENVLIEINSFVV